MALARLFQLAAWTSVALIVAFYAWITVAPGGYPGAPFAAVAMLLILALLLKLGGHQTAPFWESVPEPEQATRVIAVVAVSCALQLGVSVVLEAVGSFNWIAANLLYQVVWAGVPLVALASGFVRWPRRTGRPATKTLLALGALAVIIAVGAGYIGAIAYDGVRGTTVSSAIIAGIAIVLGATTEEIVYRVLLLTAIMTVSRSGFSALILSSLIFALIHIPPALVMALGTQDWASLPADLQAALPALVWTIGFGFIFGALWIRTGSILLVCVVHSICNLGPVLIGGLNSL